VQRSDGPGRCRAKGIQATTVRPTKVKWYLEDAEVCGLYAKWIRVAALLLGAAGALVPLIESALRLPEPRQIARWGYVLIAVGVAILALDRFGGFTWRWIRSTVIWVSLRRELAMFQHDWIRLSTAPPPLPSDPANTRKDPPKDPFQARHDRVAKFRSDVETIIAQECKDWAAWTEQRGIELQQSIDRQVSASPKA
jgi:SMODS and SLOG-associating 2TM effector domain 2